MPETTAIDPRDRLVREKYFSLRPKPLERWLWQQSLPQAAERVFWLHWEEGMRARDWCSEIPLKRVASLCCIDPSTVTRAYQILKNLGLIRRDSAGRDPHNPFHQATAVTEVRIPRALLTELSRAPNRANSIRTQVDPQAASPATPAAAIPAISPPATAPAVSSPAIPRPTRQQTQAVWARASATERARFFNASRDGQTHISFDPDSQLSPEDRAQLLAQLTSLAAAKSAPPATTLPTSHLTVSRRSAFTPIRRLSLLELARTRKRIVESVPGSHAADILGQVIWAIEEGALRRFDTPLAINIALKKIREGTWSKPNRMPPNWLRNHARAETCSAA